MVTLGAITHLTLPPNAHNPGMNQTIGIVSPFPTNEPKAIESPLCAPGVLYDPVLLGIADEKDSMVYLGIRRSAFVDGWGGVVLG